MKISETIRFDCLLHVVVFFNFCFVGYSQSATNEVSIGHSLRIDSKILDESRLIQIYLPQTYENGLYQYPVLYLTDGEDSFENAVSIVKTKSNYYQNMPEMIIVAIGSGANRNKNFTFTDGSAENTLAFLKDELIPLVDNTYRTEDYRVFYGHSLAGPFVFYTLSTEPELFDAIVTVSPGMHHVLSKPATPALIEYFNEPHQGSKRIYVSAAEYDPEKLLNQSYHMLDSLFVSSCPESIDYRFELIENEDHWGVPLIGMYKGFQYIFEDWKIPMEVVDNADVELLKAHIADRSVQYGYEVKYPEFLLNFFAMEFLEPEAEHDVSQEKMLAAAKELFELNLVNYPTSADAPFYLGMYYMQMNDGEKAINQFETCLDMEPEHQMATHYKSIAEKMTE
jgi:predicted alpha/beta superfamily hydrolase